MTEEQKISIGKMIVSDDEEMREMGIALAVANPEYIISLMKAGGSEIDFYKYSFKNNYHSGQIIPRKCYYFQYNNGYYCLTEITMFRSMFRIEKVTKGVYESNNPRTES